MNNTWVWLPLNSKYIQIFVCKSSALGNSFTNKFHPYHIQLVQELCDNDHIRQLIFCHSVQKQVERESGSFWLFDDYGWSNISQSTRKKSQSASLLYRWKFLGLTVKIGCLSSSGVKSLEMLSSA